LLVGLGTRISGGCTSGHGVCGVARAKKDSIAATITFVFFGMITVWLLRMFALTT
ncbi:MAG: YeeE/YedE family protein, partial [Chthoniobacterales bacterium]